jgi:hypothetical protein
MIATTPTNPAVRAGCHGPSAGGCHGSTASASRADRQQRAVPGAARRASLLAALLLLLLPASTRADRTDIQHTLDEMQRSVLAANQTAYLACISRDDPVYFKEQSNWAKDLAKHPPADFTLTIGDGDSTFGPDHARFDLAMTWRLPEWDQTDSRTVSFPVIFDREPESGRWLFAGEEWIEVHGPGVLVKCRPGLEDTAQRVADLLPDIRKHVHDGFELTIDRVQQVKLYSSMRHLQASIYLSYLDPLSGWNEPGEAIKLLVGKSTGAGELKPLLAHEYGHVATFEMGDKASDMPWWVAEGVAELAAEAYHDGGRRSTEGVVRTWAKAGKLVDWDKMSDFRATAKEHIWNVYAQGHHMLGYISQRWGRTARNAWIRALTQGTPLDKATQDAFGIPFTQLDTEWRASLTTEKPAEKTDK